MVRLYEALDLLAADHKQPALFIVPGLSVIDQPSRRAAMMLGFM